MFTLRTEKVSRQTAPRGLIAGVFVRLGARNPAFEHHRLTREASEQKTPSPANLLSVRQVVFSHPEPTPQHKAHDLELGAEKLLCETAVAESVIGDIAALALQTGAAPSAQRDAQEKLDRLDTEILRWHIHAAQIERLVTCTPAPLRSALRSRHAPMPIFRLNNLGVTHPSRQTPLASPVPNTTSPSLALQKRAPRPSQVMEGLHQHVDRLEATIGQSRTAMENRLTAQPERPRTPKAMKLLAPAPRPAFLKPQKADDKD